MNVKIHVGDTVSTNCGTGFVVAITKEWIIIKNENGEENASLISDNDIHIDLKFIVNVENPNYFIEVKTFLA